MDDGYAVEVEDIITSLPERDPCPTLRTELVRWLSPSRELGVHQLIMFQEVGDRKQSQLLRHIRSLIPSIWSSQLPPT
jgi:hypothetical protein